MTPRKSYLCCKTSRAVSGEGVSSAWGMCGLQLPTVSGKGVSSAYGMCGLQLPTVSWGGCELPASPFSSNSDSFPHRETEAKVSCKAKAGHDLWAPRVCVTLSWRRCFSTMSLTCVCTWAHVRARTCMKERERIFSSHRSRSLYPMPGFLDVWTQGNNSL